MLNIFKNTSIVIEHLSQVMKSVIHSQHTQVKSTSFLKKCSINFLDIESIKQKSFILLEKVLKYLVGVVVGKINLVPNIQIHQKKIWKKK